MVDIMYDLTTKYRFIAALTILFVTQPLIAAGTEYRVGLAEVDITPSYPVRLNGFGFRRAESEGVTQRIWAKALAIDDGSRQPIVIVAVDSLGFPLSMVKDVGQRLQREHNLARHRFAVTFTHSHTTPKVNGASDTIFSTPIPSDHQSRIDRYTAELTDWIERVATDAIRNLRPSSLAWSIGRVGFAENRRTEGGLVDHDLPMLVVRDTATKKIRGIYVSYACHCVTLSHNRISGDWAGYAQEIIARNHRGATALVSIGCGSDSNPDSGVSGDNVALAAAQGEQIAREVERLLKTELRPLSGPITPRLETIQLPLNEPPTRAQLEEMIQQGGAGGYNAQFQLAKLARGEKLQSSITYPIQTFSFGRSLAMVFLPGEVCVDYSLRLKRELAADRIWLNAYANDFCAYIPSERLLREGGYGGGAEIVYFALPSTLQPGLEERIIRAVHRLVPDEYSR